MSYCSVVYVYPIGGILVEHYHLPPDQLCMDRDVIQHLHKCLDQLLDLHMAAADLASAKTLKNKLTLIRQTKQYRNTTIHSLREEYIQKELCDKAAYELAKDEE